MPTPNERTVPSPERDELEKFIKSQLDESLADVRDDEAYESPSHGYSDDVVIEICREVAAFSARRARKKAIQECYLLACCKSSHVEGSTCGVDSVLEELFDGESVESILDGHQIPQDVMKGFRIWTSMEGIKELIDKNIVGRIIRWQ